MTYILQGVNIVPYIAYQGVKWTRADVDGPNAGRNLFGTTIRDRVAVKMRCDITCRPLFGDELSLMLNLVYPEFVTFAYTDERTKKLVQGTFYSNNFSYSFIQKNPDGRELWHLDFPLIMQ